MTGIHAHDDGDPHGPPAAGSRRLGLAALVTGVFMLVEFGGGLLSGSLALIADAGHMLTDFGALTLAFFAARLAVRPADWKRTYGFDRFSVLVGFVNGLALFAIAGFILFEAVRRLFEPVAIAGPLMLAVAVAGLVVNLIAFWILRGAGATDLNTRAAALHVLGDLLGSVAAILAAAIIILTGWTMADPILSMVVVLLILRSATIVVHDAARILLEAAPREIDTRRIAADLLAAIPAVRDVHHVHAWSISESRPMLTLHARVANGGRPETVAGEIKRRLADEFGIGHATIEIEFEDCSDTPPDAVPPSG